MDAVIGAADGLGILSASCGGADEPFLGPPSGADLVPSELTASVVESWCIFVLPVTSRPSLFVKLNSPPLSSSGDNGRGR